MNSVLLVCCLFVFAGMVHSDTESRVDEVFAEELQSCAEELQIPPTEVSKIHDPELQGEDRKKFGCLQACMLKRLKALDDGEIKLENLHEPVEKLYSNKPEEIPSKIEMLHKCAEEVKGKSEDCELAFEFSRCIMANDKE